MSFEDIFQFQQALEKAEKELAEIEKENTEEKKDDYGFSEVLKERQKKKDALKEKLLTLNFTEKEINKLFKIISSAEDEMEKIKKGYNYKEQIPGQAVKMQKDLLETQRKMKIAFDSEFDKILKAKHNKK